MRRRVPGTPGRPNERWAVDVMYDTLADGRTLRVLTVLEICSRECVALFASRGFSGKDVGWILSEAGKERRALPEKISVDNGTEFTSGALDHWACSNQVELNFSWPGRPGDNPHIGGFDSVFRRECLTKHWFFDLRDAQMKLNRWRLDHNMVRPYGGLRRFAPAQPGAAFYTPGPERLRNLRSQWTKVGGRSPELSDQHSRWYRCWGQVRPPWRRDVSHLTLQTGQP